MSDKATFGRFLRHARSGNIGMLTAFLIVPMVAACGLAIDGARAMLLRYELQGATDAAALAVGTTFGSQEELEALATGYVARNFDMAGASLGDVTVASDAENVTIGAAATMRTYFIGLVHKGDISVSSQTDVRRAGGGLMVSFVLDNTGSMWSGLSGTSRIEALRSASISLADSLFEEEEEEELRVSVVPYSAMVNPGDEAQDIVPIVSDPGDEDANMFRVPDPQNRAGFPAEDLPMLFYNPSDKTQWKGCVFERQGDNSIDDTPPSTAMWEPLIWPIYNDNQYELHKEHWSDPVQVDPDTVDPGGDRNSNHFTGPNVGCPTPILPLTGDRSDVMDALGDMTAWNRGGTLADIGMAWGIRTLSPGAPFTESADYRDPKTNVPIWDSNRWRRAIVLMTDGDNTVYNAGNEGHRVQAGYERSDVTGYGRLGDSRFRGIIDTGNSGTAKTRVEERLATLCNRAKADDITVYAVVFANSANSSTRLLYESCASDPGKYWFAPSADSLDNAFGAIGSELNKLRITR